MIGVIELFIQYHVLHVIQHMLIDYELRMLLSTCFDLWKCRSDLIWQLKTKIMRNNEEFQYYYNIYKWRKVKLNNFNFTLCDCQYIHYQTKLNLGGNFLISSQLKHLKVGCTCDKSMHILNSQLTSFSVANHVYYKICLIKTFQFANHEFKYERTHDMNIHIILPFDITYINMYIVPCTQLIIWPHTLIKLKWHTLLSETVLPMYLKKLKVHHFNMPHDLSWPLTLTHLSLRTYDQSHLHLPACLKYLHLESFNGIFTTPLPDTLRFLHLNHYTRMYPYDNDQSLEHVLNTLSLRHLLLNDWMQRMILRSTTLQMLWLPSYDEYVDQSLLPQLKVIKTRKY